MNTEIVEAKQDVVADEDCVVLNSETVEAKQDGVADEDCVDLIKKELNSILSSTPTKCSIFRVHEKFRKVNESAYTPESISIGPFHRGKESSKAMEDHKLRYASKLLSRAIPTGINDKVVECFAHMKTIEDKARKCYSEPINLSSDEFSKMMMIDGLFMIELFIIMADKSEKPSPGDLIFSTIWGLSSSVHDLVLLENQIPMFVLECLFNLLELKKLKGVSLNSIALQFFDQLMPPGNTEASFLSKYQGKHLLDLLRKSLRPLKHGNSGVTKKMHKKGNKKKSSGKPISCATELKLAGIKFVRSTTSGSFMDIKFKDGVMEIPHIKIQDQFDAMMRNFIAFEQYSGESGAYMTSYACFMDHLINSGQDVGVLRKEGIITHYLGDDEAVAALFNKFCCEVTLPKSYYSELSDEVNLYYDTPWHVWGATLKRDYFSSPWSIVSLVGASILIVLTFLATLYAILSYIQQSKK